MERKLTKVVDGTEITETGKMCSCGIDVVDNLCSWECPDTRRDGCLAFQGRDRLEEYPGRVLFGRYGHVGVSGWCYLPSDQSVCFGAYRSEGFQPVYFSGETEVRTGSWEKLQYAEV